jgi:hypothetical protein
MQYILDFDRTLFDTDAFKKAQVEQCSPSSVGAIGTLDELDVAEFMFKDAIEFLQSHQKADLCIVTSCCGITGVCDTAYQKTKLEKSGVYELVKEVHIVFNQKIRKLKTLFTGEPMTFVDDVLSHVEAAKEAIPELQTVHIRRADVLRAPDEQNDGSIPTITTLDELDAIIEV